jgi:hypothetical protein
MRRSPTIITETLEDGTRVPIRIEGELEMKIAVEVKGRSGGGYSRVASWARLRSGSH